MASDKFDLKLSVLEKIVGLTHQVFFIYDREANYIIHVNQAFELVWGRSVESISHTPALLLSTVHPEDREYVQKQYNSLVNDRENKNIEFRITLPDQSIKWICVSAFVLEEEGIPIVTGIAEDISKVKEYNFNLMKFNSKKNSLLEILSHDLSGPLATIQGMSALVKSKYEKSAKEDVGEFIEIIHDTAKRGMKLIREFVNQEALESSEIVVYKERHDLVAKIKDIIEEFKRMETPLSKQFGFVASHPSIYAEVDEVKFLQIIHNLISNSIKFTPDHGVINTTIEERKDKILLTVADNGIGIPRDIQPYLFDKFTKARRPGLRGEQTTGLGMSIIKTLVELHQGRIWFESEENKGATFYIEIPKNSK
jgi:two-component system, OmpR family, sensor histidine kinase VicK